MPAEDITGHARAWTQAFAQYTKTFVLSFEYAATRDQTSTAGNFLLEVTWQDATTHDRQRP